MITSSTTSWFNTRYCDKGFAFLIPHNRNEATLALVVNAKTQNNIDNLWDIFLKEEQINYKITQIQESRISCGFIKTFKKDNLYFVGTAAGLIDNLVGVGTFNAIESGIFAAQSIAGKSDYSLKLKPIAKEIAKYNELRKAVNKFEYHNYDALLSFTSIPGIKQLFHSSPFVKMTHIAPIATVSQTKINI